MVLQHSSLSHTPGHTRFAAQQIHNSNQRKQHRKPHLHPHSRKAQSPQAQQEARQAHTREKSRNPNVLHLRPGTEGLGNSPSHIKTILLLLQVSILSLAPPTSLFPLLLTSSFASLFFSLSYSLPATSSHSQLLRKFSSRSKSPSSLGEAPCLPTFSFLAMFHNPFCAMTPQTLPGSSFSPSTFHPFCASVWHPFFFKFEDLSAYYFMSFLFLACSDSTILIPAFAAHNRTLSAPNRGPSISVNSSHHVVTSQVLGTSNFSACVWSLPCNHWGPSHILCILFFAASTASHTTIILLPHTPFDAFLLSSCC